MNWSSLNPNAPVFIPRIHNANPTESTPTEITCSCCLQQLPEDKFSKHQLYKNSNVRKCRKCLRTNQKFRKCNSVVLEDIQNELNENQKIMFLNIVNTLESVQKNKSMIDEFHQNIIQQLFDNIFSHLHHKSRSIYAQRFKIYIPSQFKKYYQKQIQIMELKNKLKDTFTTTEYQIMTITLNKIKEAGNSKHISCDIRSLFALSPDIDLMKKCKILIPLKFRAIYGMELRKFEQHRNSIKQKILNRIFNAFKYNERYDVLVAVAFRDFINKFEWHLRVYQQKHTYNCEDSFADFFMDKFSSWFGIGQFRNFVRYLPTTLASENRTDIISFIQNSMHDKSLDMEIFDDEMVKLQHNPLPSELLSKTRFIEFVTNCSKYLINHIVHYIYQYVTGYSFDISIQNKKELHMSIECYDCFGNKEMIETLSMHNSYNIIYKKIQHDFGKMYTVEFECLGEILGIARIYERDCTDQDFWKHSVVIQSILNHYNCNYNNFKKLFVAVEDISVTRVERERIETNIVTQCQADINEQIEGFQRHHNEYSHKAFANHMHELISVLQYLYDIDDSSTSE